MKKLSLALAAIPVVAAADPADRDDQTFSARVHLYETPYRIDIKLKFADAGVELDAQIQPGLWSEETRQADRQAYELTPMKQNAASVRAKERVA